MAPLLGCSPRRKSEPRDSCFTDFVGGLEPSGFHPEEEAREGMTALSRRSVLMSEPDFRFRVITGALCFGSERHKEDQKNERPSVHALTVANRKRFNTATSRVTH